MDSTKNKNNKIKAEKKILDLNEEKQVQAKILSKVSMLFATVWIAVLTILKFFDKIDAEISDIIYSGAAVVALWSPTYISTWLDKLKELKK